MPSKARIYGQVLREVLERTPEKEHKTVFQNFKALVKKRGDLRLLSKAVLEFQRAWRSRKGKAGIVIFAKPPSVKMRRAVSKTLRHRGFVYEEKVDPGLGGGTQIFLGNEVLVDNSIQGKIRTLWQKTTSSTF